MTNAAQQRTLDAICSEIFDRHCVGLTPHDRLIVHRVVANVIQHPMISTEAVAAIGPILTECCAAAKAVRDAEQASTTA